MMRLRMSKPKIKNQCIVCKDTAQSAPHRCDIENELQRLKRPCLERLDIDIGGGVTVPHLYRVTLIPLRPL